MDKGIRLDIALVERGLCESRTEAKELIEKGLVFVDGLVCSKPAKEIFEKSAVELRGKRAFVSRAGEKLDGALRDVFKDKESIHEHFLGKSVLDIGSSTGGFSECILAYGASHVDAVDVGSNQFHQSLRSDKRVSLYENQDIRTFKQNHHYDVVLSDLSFISTIQLLPTIVAFASSGGMMFLLIKPQFEVGRGNTKKGIVKDEKLIETVLSEALKKAQSLGLKNIRIIPSKVSGSDGNQEYFLCASS